MSKADCPPPICCFPLFTQPRRKRPENSLLRVTQKIDSADQVACDTLIGWARWGLAVEWDTVQLCSLITVTGEAANITKERETQTTKFTDLPCPVFHMKQRPSHPFLTPCSNTNGDMLDSRNTNRPAPAFPGKTFCCHAITLLTLHCQFQCSSCSQSSVKVWWSVTSVVCTGGTSCYHLLCGWIHTGICPALKQHQGLYLQGHVVVVDM